MRIACTTCNALYDLPPERVRPGRGVRCARCKTVWVPVEQEDAAPEIRPVEVPRPLARADDAIMPIPETPGAGSDLPAAEPKAILPVPPAPLVPADGDTRVAGVVPVRPGRALGPLVGWVASVAVLGAAAYAVIAFRGPIAQLWPPSQRFYAWLGMG